MPPRPLPQCQSATGAFLYGLVQDGVLRLAHVLRQALPTSYGSARRHKTTAAFLT